MIAEPKVVPYVELERYLGTWYEIARYPQRFQEGCVASKDSTQPPGPRQTGGEPLPLFADLCEALKILELLESVGEGPD